MLTSNLVLKSQDSLFDLFVSMSSCEYGITSRLVLLLCKFVKFNRRIFDRIRSIARLYCQSCFASLWIQTTRQIDRLSFIKLHTFYIRCWFTKLDLWKNQMRLADLACSVIAFFSSAMWHHDTFFRQYRHFNHHYSTKTKRLEGQIEWNCHILLRMCFVYTPIFA